MGLEEPKKKKKKSDSRSGSRTLSTLYPKTEVPIKTINGWIPFTISKKSASQTRNLQVDGCPWIENLFGQCAHY